MHRAYLISLVLIILLVGFLARTEADTSAEIFPLDAAINWVEGHGPFMSQDLVPAGIRPTHAYRAGPNLRPRTPPAMMVYYGAVCRVFRNSIERPLDGADLPSLIKILNFLGVLPWALLLFAALVRLARTWGAGDGTGPVWSAWAVMAGSLAFGWLGVVSVYLPVAALACWTVALVSEAQKRPDIRLLLIAGLCAGFAGAAHPSGWIWAVWGLFMLFVSPPKDVPASRQMVLTTVFGIAAAVGIVITLIGNFLFFGTPLPVQWIDTSGIAAGQDLVRLIWHDVVGFNGIVWLAPLVLTGVLALTSKKSEEGDQSVLKFTLGLAVAALLVWGIADDARLVKDIGGIDPRFQVMPAELDEGRFAIVRMGGSTGTYEEFQVYFEDMVVRKDVFYSTVARSPGMPVFLPAAVLIGLFGWCSMRKSRFSANWSWIGVRWSGLLGLIMSGAPYGAVPGVFLYLASGLEATGIPILGSILAMALKLAELMPSSVISF